MKFLLFLRALVESGVGTFLLLILAFGARDIGQAILHGDTVQQQTYVLIGILATLLLLSFALFLLWDSFRLQQRMNKP